MGNYLEIERQRQKNAEYERHAEEWVKTLSPAEIADMKARGLIREERAKNGTVTYTLADTGQEPAAEQGREVVGHEEDAAMMADGRRDLSTEPDMARDVDRLPEQLAERFGLRPEQARAVALFVEARVEEATMQTHSLLLARIVGFFLQGSENLQARAHGLAHAARMAGINGLTSLRHSARLCGVSPEWMGRVAWKWCELLDLPPLEGAKSMEARKAYSEDKKKNHWRKRPCTLNKPLHGAAKATTTNTPIHPKIQTPKG